MTTEKWYYRKAFVVLLPFAAAIFLFLAATLFLDYAYLLPECAFHQYTGWLCPACGETRSVAALLHGRIVDSLRYNVLPIFALIFAAAAYLELLLRAFGKQVAIIPRKSAFYIVLFALFVAYWILRNLFPLF